MLIILTLLRVNPVDPVDIFGRTDFVGHRLPSPLGYFRIFAWRVYTQQNIDNQTDLIRHFGSIDGHVPFHGRGVIIA